MVVPDTTIPVAVVAISAAIEMVIRRAPVFVEVISVTAFVSVITPEVSAEWKPEEREVVRLFRVLLPTNPLPL